MKRYRVRLVIEKEVYKTVRAKTDNQAIAKAKRLVVAKPPKIRLKDFEQYPEADAE